MAHIETWYRCPTCNRVFDELKHAISCKNQHQIRSEKWAVGKGGKAVKIQKNHKNGFENALSEADLRLRVNLTETAYLKSATFLSIAIILPKESVSALIKTDLLDFAVGLMIETRHR